MAVKYDEARKASGFLNVTLAGKTGSVSLGALVLRESNPKHQKIHETLVEMDDEALAKFIAKRLSFTYRSNTADSEFEI